MRCIAPLLLLGILVGVQAGVEPGSLLAQESGGDASPAAQDDGLDTPSPLGVRQQRVIRMMQDLERKFTSLSQTLEQTEPERAERLVKAFQQSKQLLIEDRMAGIVKLLNETRLDPASEQQGEIISDLRTLIELLLDDDSYDEKQKEIDQLEEWRARVQDLLNKERALRDESDRLNNKDQTLAELQAQIKALEGIIKKQEEVVRATDSAKALGVAGLNPVADKQHAVRGETEDLAERVGGKSNPSASEGAPEPKSGEPNSSEPGAENNPGGEKSGASGGKQPGEKSGGEKSGGEKSGSASGEKSGGEGSKAGGSEKSGEAGGDKSGGKGGEKSGGAGGEKSGGEKSGGAGEQSGDGKQGGGEESGGGEKSDGGQQAGGEQQGGEQSSGDPAGGAPRPGEESLRQASKHQQKAESNLGSGKGQPAKEDEQKALVELNKALEELKQEHSRIAKLPPEMFDELADKQDQNSKDTEALGDEIAKAESGGDQPGGDKQGGGEQGGGEQGGGKQGGGEKGGGEQGGGEQGGGEQGGGQQGGGQQGGGQKPGQEDLKGAKQSMDKASGDLKKQDTKGAGKNQDEAIEKLKKAIKEIEERLAQLREETQLEKLTRLQQRFQEMLNLQIKASQATIELHAKRDEDGDLKRTDRLAVAKVAEAERVIAELARLAEEIIIEDGTSVVFPRVTEHLRSDLTGVAGLLDKQRTDKFTQGMQSDIEQTLRELIDALEKAKKQQEGEQGGGGGGGGGGGMEEPLLPSSAELKLLRSAQLRVNRRTKSIDEARVEGELDETLKQELGNAAALQREITELAEEILEKY